MTMVIAWRTTKLIEGSHRGLQAYRPICYYFYVFLRFLRFFSKSKKRDFLRFLPCFIRFLELCTNAVFFVMANAAGQIFIVCQHSELRKASTILQVTAAIIMFVCLYICRSVTRWYSVKHEVSQDHRRIARDSSFTIITQKFDTIHSKRMR